MRRTGIGYFFWFFIAVITLVAIMKFVGITWNDIDYFITHGLKTALELIGSLKGSAGSSIV